MKKTVSLSLDHDVVEGIKALAEESDRSFSQYVNMVLKRILKNKAEREEKEEYDRYCPSLKEGLFCAIMFAKKASA